MSIFSFWGGKCYSEMGSEVATRKDFRCTCEERRNYFIAGASHQRLEMYHTYEDQFSGEVSRGNSAWTEE